MIVDTRPSREDSAPALNRFGGSGAVADDDGRSVSDIGVAVDNFDGQTLDGMRSELLTLDVQGTKLRRTSLNDPLKRMLVPTSDCLCAGAGAASANPGRTRAATAAAIMIVVRDEVVIG